ncbi:MAG: hypothetical protein Q9209_005767 [Squamulea sp. 1 TL-2023]
MLRYQIPGTNPVLTLWDRTSRHPYDAVDPLQLYQTLSGASIKVCSVPPKEVPHSFKLSNMPLEVAFQRMGPREGPGTVRYEWLCQALRGMGEYVTREKLYQSLEMRLSEGSQVGVKCDIHVYEPEGVVEAGSENSTATA